MTMIEEWGNKTPEREDGSDVGSPRAPFKVADDAVLREFKTSDLMAELRRRGAAPARTAYEDVGAFHVKFELPHEHAGPPRQMDWPEYKFRTNFLFEELREFCEGYAAGNIPKQADALADLAWVALGTAHHMRLPFDSVWAEIRRANMEKRRWQEGDPIKARNVTTDHEIVKPAGWREPDHVEAIQAARARYYKF